MLKSVEPGVGSSPSTCEWRHGDSDSPAVAAAVKDILSGVREGRETACLAYARDLDGCTLQTALLDPAEVDRQTASLADSTKDDIRFQHERVRAFARAQLQFHAREFELELTPGVHTGQRLIPVQTAGCYVPGGRFAHVSSATMTIATAKAAGVENVIAASPPVRGTNSIHPATLYAMQVAGADHILCLGGAHAVAALAYGCFTGRSADVLVGPGNKYVAEAKRVLFGRVGIDVIAGPTEILVLCDESSDPFLVANDVVAQAEHGPDSPTWVFTTSERVGREVCRLVPLLAGRLPPGNVAEQAWRDFGEVVLLGSREDMATLSDHYAAEHVQVMTEEPTDWWLARLRNYGSLFLGQETQTTYGDKCAGPNHVLPTRGGARYSGGLSVDAFIKRVTYQSMTPTASAQIGLRAARISRLEGMEGHARSCDVRCEKFSRPDQSD